MPLIVSQPTHSQKHSKDGCVKVPPAASPQMQGHHLGSLLTEIRLLESDIPLRVAFHVESMTAMEKQALLPEGIFVQKSVSLFVGRQLVLVSGIGDFHIARWQVRWIARLFSLPADEAHSHIVNPPWLAAELTSGLPAGMVSPFFPPGFSPAYAAVILLPTIGFIQTGQVAISTSLRSSVLFPLNRLTDLICAYGLRHYPQIPIVSLPPPALSLIQPPKQG